MVTLWHDRAWKPQRFFRRGDGATIVVFAIAGRTDMASPIPGRRVAASRRATVSSLGQGEPANPAVTDAVASRSRYGA